MSGGPISFDGAGPCPACKKYGGTASTDGSFSCYCGYYRPPRRLRSGEEFCHKCGRDLPDCKCVVAP